jgi:DNA-binding NarL/FixJ family response regulator
MGAKKIMNRHFTKVELEVIRLVAEGKTNKEIADDLHWVEGTVKNYLQNILNKTGLKNRVQLAVYYMKDMKDDIQ